MSANATLAIGLGSVGGAIALGVYLIATAARKPAPSEVAAKLQQVAVLTPPPPRRDVYEEPLPTVMARLRAFVLYLSPKDYTKRVQYRLDLAGNPPNMPAERFVALKGIGLIMGGLAGAALGAKRGFSVVVFALIGAAIGFFLPDLLLRNAGEHRQDSLLKHMADALDMLVVCVEAGLGFDSALSRVAQNTEGPMAQECARVVQEMQFGKSRAEALRALADRTSVQEIRVFVSALIQAGELGISVGNVLREQAAEMRVRRRQRAEEKAQKLPVKILMPLITCLLPAMFVVVLGPAAIKIVHTLGHLGG